MQKEEKVPDEISATEIVKKYSISYQTLNHYTNLGLLIAHGRRGFMRMYAEGEIRARLKKIKELKDRGYTLRAIADLIDSGGGT